MSTIRKLIAVSTFCALTIIPTNSNAAPVPPEVMTSYKAYAASVQSGDYKGALKHAKRAWKMAETAMGDSNVTGELAYNYGVLSAKNSKFSDAILGLERSIVLAELGGAESGNIRLRRVRQLAFALEKNGKGGPAWKQLKAARQFASDNNLEHSLDNAGIMLQQALHKNTKANNTAKKPRQSLRSQPVQSRAQKIQDTASDYAKSAIEIYEKHKKNVSKQDLQTAYLLVGFAHERNEDWIDATLVYQKAMLLKKQDSKLADPEHAAIVGRWLVARNRIKGSEQLEKAKQRGVCKCWPYADEVDDKISAEYVHKVPPRMPGRAYTSGFTIVKYDLNDEGGIINPEIIQSWPKKSYERSSLAVLKKWKYETKADGIVGAQREGIINVISYILSDGNGNRI